VREPEAAGRVMFFTRTFCYCMDIVSQ